MVKLLGFLAKYLISADLTSDKWIFPRERGIFPESVLKIY